MWPSNAFEPFLDILVVNCVRTRQAKRGGPSWACQGHDGLPVDLSSLERTLIGVGLRLRIVKKREEEAKYITRPRKGQPPPSSFPEIP